MPIEPVSLAPKFTRVDGGLQLPSVAEMNEQLASLCSIDDAMSFVSDPQQHLADHGGLHYFKESGDSEWEKYIDFQGTLKEVAIAKRLIRGTELPNPDDIANDTSIVQRLVISLFPKDNRVLTVDTIIDLPEVDLS